MDAFLNQTFALAADNSLLAGGLLFVLTLLEALLVVGVLIPIVGVMLAMRRSGGPRRDASSRGGAVVQRRRGGR